MIGLRLALLSLAIVVGLVGILVERTLVLFLAIALVVLAFRNLPDAPSRPSIRPAPLVFYASVLLAVTGTVLAAWLSVESNYQFNPTAIGLWAGSLVLLVVGARAHDGGVRAHDGGARVHDDRGSGTGLGRNLRSRWSRTHLLQTGLVTLVVLVALGLRVIALDRFPSALHGDEGEVGMLALRIVEGEEPLSPFATTIFGQNPAGFEYLVAPAIALFGRNEVGLRMASAILGTLSVLLAYLIGRRGWGTVAGLSAAWLMAVSHLHIHFSRMALPNMGSAFSLVLMTWVLLLAVDRNDEVLAQRGSASLPEGEPAARAGGRWTTLRRLDLPMFHFVGLGLVVGLSQYFYYGSRLLPVLAVVALLFLLLCGRVSLVQAAVAGSVSLIAFAPLGAYYLEHGDAFVGRSGDVFVFTRANLQHTMGANATFAADGADYLLYQIRQVLGFFIQDGDSSTFYVRDVAAFDPLTALLLWLGVGVVLARPGRFQEFMLVTWFLIGLILGGFLTVNQPNAPRLLAMIAVVYLLAGVFVQRLWSLAIAIGGERLRPTLAGGMVVLALVLFSWNARVYFLDHDRYAHSLLPVAVARALATLPPGYQGYLLGDPVLYAGHGTIRYLAGTQDLFDLRDPEALPSPGPATPGLMVVSLEHRLSDLAAIESRYPGGTRTAYSDSLGRLLYVSYTIPPQE